jgi:hypothetical protein
MIILSSVLISFKITSSLLILKEAFILLSLEFFKIFLDFLNTFTDIFSFNFLILLVSIRISLDPFLSRVFLVRIWLVCSSYCLMEFSLLSLEELSFFFSLLLSENSILSSSLLLFLLIDSNLFFDSQHLNRLSLDMTLMAVNNSCSFPFNLQAL